MKRLLSLLRNIGPFFRHLRWKLAFSYIVMTALALLITVAISMGVLTNWIVSQYPQAAFSVLRQEALTVTQDLQGRHANQQDLSDELSYIDYNVWSGYFSENTGAEMGFSSLTGYTVVADFRGKILASSDSTAPVGARLQTLLSADGMRIFLAARSGATSLDQTVVVNSQMVLIGAKALITKRGRFVGVLLTRQGPPSWHTILFATFPLIWLPVTLLVTVVGMVGIVYSLLMSRWLVRRFKRVAVAAENWSKGDFSLIARDTSGDELGLMARQLNTMAGKLEQLLRERQGLAALEERNRLARDLHDNLKQRMFAITMQVWSAQAVLEPNVNVDSARERLRIIEHLLDQAQQELSSLIFQLRPIELAEKPLGEALREYCERWS
jgi:NarL family two-component system sensor histidine kinase LiaS